MGVADGPNTIPEDVVMFPPFGALVAETLLELIVDVLTELLWAVGIIEALPDSISLMETEELGLIKLGKGELDEVAGGGLKLASCRLIGTLFAAPTVGLLFARRTRTSAESCHGALIFPASDAQPRT